MMEYLLIIIAAAFVISFIIYRRTQKHDNNNIREKPDTSPKPEPFFYRYQITDGIGIVWDFPTKYDRTNDYGHRFHGTTLRLRNLLDVSVIPISYEGIYDFAEKGERVDTIFATQSLPPFNPVLAVSVINRSRGTYIEVSKNMEKVASEEKGGLIRLKKEIEMYVQIHLGVTL